MFSKAFNCCPTNDDYFESEKLPTHVAHIEHTTFEQSSTGPETANVRIAFFGPRYHNEIYNAKIGNQTTIKKLEQKLRNDCKQFRNGTLHLMIVALPQGFTVHHATKLHLIHPTSTQSTSTMDTINTITNLIHTSRKNFSKSILTMNKHHRKQDSLDWIKYKLLLKKNRYINPARKRNQKYAQMINNLPLPGRVFDHNDRILNHIRVEQDKKDGGLTLHIGVVPYFDNDICGAKLKVDGACKKACACVDRFFWKVVF